LFAVHLIINYIQINKYLNEQKRKSIQNMLPFQRFLSSRSRIIPRTLDIISKRFDRTLHLSVQQSMMHWF